MLANNSSACGDRLSRALVEDTISVEVNASATERRPDPTASGHIRSHPSALTTRDVTYSLPDFLPIGSVAFPDALLRLWGEMRYCSLAGLFPTLSRMWLVVDNKLILWDYRGRSEFTVCDEIPGLIVSVGTPVKPLEGVFQPHVTLLLPVATSDMVFLLGLCVVNEEQSADIKVVSLGYSAAAPAMIMKITGAPETGRVFCAGADGEVYEVRYMRESTPVVPKIRLVCFSFLFSSRPIIGEMMSAVNHLKETWTGRKVGLADVVVDERQNLLLTLDKNSTITAWRIVSDGLRRAKSVAHKAGGRLMGGNRDYEESVSPLVKLFIVEPDQEGCTLVAIALNGDQHRYLCANHTMGGDYNVELTRCSVVPSYIPTTKRQVGICYAGGTTVIIADYFKGDDEEGAEEDAEDELIVSTSPRSVMQPHSKARDIVATFGPSSSSASIVRVDAIEAVPSARQRSPYDLCSQVCYAPPLFIVLHRHGLAFYMQMRPVDTLFTIVSRADPQCRESLLKRFGATYEPIDYATMLLQVAVGGLNAYRSCGMTGLPSSLFSGSGVGTGDGAKGYARTGLVSPLDADGMLSLESLGQHLMNGDSPEARRLARDLLKSMSVCATQTGTSVAAAAAAASGRNQVTVIMSPFASSVVTYLSRALYSVWEVPMHKLGSDDLMVVEEAVSLLVRFLDSIEVPSFSEESLRVDLPHQWQQGNKVVVSLSSAGPSSTLPNTDVTKLQLTLLLSAYQVAQKALQTVFLLRRSFYLPMRQEDRLVTVAQMVRDRDVARSVGQYLSQILLGSQQGVGAASTERLKTFAALQKRCPYFFSDVSVQEFQARADIEALTRGSSLGTFSEAELVQWMATVSPNAASYWSSGALQSICQQLNQLKREDVAIQLLLHAAYQLDPNGIAFPVYLAHLSDDTAGTTNLSNTTIHSGPTASREGAYQTKKRIVGLVTGIMELAWQRHRTVVDSLLGSPRVSGAIWAVEPNDEMVHCLLFDWLRAPRADAAMTQTLRDTLVVARSPFLESYLLRNRAYLGEEYAHYLRYSQRNYQAAIEQCLVLAQSPLSHIPLADRLAYRIRCTSEAVECAWECRSDQLIQVKQRLRLLEAQQRLVCVVADFLNSRLDALRAEIRIEGRTITQREIAQQHVGLLSSYVMTASQLLEISGMYTTFGGAEVQLDVLTSSNVSDTASFAVCITQAYNLRDSNPADVSRRLVTQYYKVNPNFPISFVVRMQEADAFARYPQGTEETVRLLVDECSVDAKILFYAYHDIVSAKESMDVPCEAFDKAGVTRSYLIHSMAVAMLYLCTDVRRGTLQMPVASRSMGHVQDLISTTAAEGNLDANERAALEKAEGCLQRASFLVNA